MQQQRDGNIAKNPKLKQYYQERHDRELAGFKKDRIYDYGPPRLRVTQQLGPQPRVIAEFDVDGSPSSPGTYTFLARFTTETAASGSTML